MILNISPRFVWEPDKPFISHSLMDGIVFEGSHLPGKPYIPTYAEIMRCKELDMDYKGRWME